MQFFDQNLIFVAENQVYNHCGDVCNDLILMPVSRGSAVTYFRCGWSCYTFCSKFNRFSSSEIVLKIG